MKFLSSSRSVILLGLLLITLIALIKNPSDPYDRFIGGDAKGYYAYLPAAFIYGDFSYGFVDDIEKKHYNDNPAARKDFLTETEHGGKVNKTFPGASLFYMPFFLLAHVLTFLSPWEADGYSYLYQWVLPVAHVFYFCCALLLLQRMSKRKGWEMNRFWLVVLVALLGTQLGYYLVFDLTLIHLFGWAMMIFTIDLIDRIFERPNTIKFFLLGLFLGILLILRPTNLLALLFLPFVGFVLGWNWKLLINQLISRKGITALLGIIIPIFLMSFLWYAQSGHWVVYSYGEEGFNFAEPHMLNFTFGYEKGWLLYTPLAAILIILCAVYFIRKWSLFSGVYWIFSWVLVVYIFSSWWYWNYGFGFSQRVMIEYSVFFLLPVMKMKFSNKFFTLTTPLVLLSIWQSYQVRFGVLPGGMTTKEIYWKHFFDGTPNAFFFVPEEYSLRESIAWKSPQEKLQNNAFSYNYSFKPEKPIHKGDFVKITMDIKSSAINDELRIVMGDGKAQVYQAFFFAQKVDQNEFTTVEYGFEVPMDFGTEIEWVLYIWDPKMAAQITTQNVVIEFYTKSNVSANTMD